MQIACPCGKKTFEVDASLIPSKGRLLQCGYCNEEWFYKNDEIAANNLSYKSSPSIEISEDSELPINTENIIKEAEEAIKKPIEKKIHQSVTSIEENKTIDKDQNLIGKIFSYTIVGIISFVALIILLDTFKSPLTENFPKLDYFLVSLYETLKDIELFIIDLI